MTRKTPILLRREPFSGRIVAVTRYTQRADGLIRTSDGGKHDVTQEFCALCVELGMGVPPGFIDTSTEAVPGTADPANHTGDTQSPATAPSSPSSSASQL